MIPYFSKKRREAERREAARRAEMADWQPGLGQITLTGRTSQDGTPTTSAPARANGYSDMNPYVHKFTTDTYTPAPRTRNVESGISGNPAYEIPQNRHIYVPLKVGEMRVLELLSGRDESPLECRLHTCAIENSPSYEAVSYVWGSDPQAHNITVNNLKIGIRRNLLSALQRLRREKQPVLLWADSLCINQTDNTEKSEQVRQMAQIYKRAYRVLIWVGEEDDVSRVALDFAKRLAKGSYDDSFLSDDCPWVEDRYSVWAGYGALAKFLDRPWFHRGWVLQEAALASEAIILCGRRTISIDLIQKAIFFASSKVERIEEVLRSSISAHYDDKKLANLRSESPGYKLLEAVNGVFSVTADQAQDRFSSPCMSLEQLVVMGAFWQTSDPKDAIYAVLNLSKVSDSVIVPDYGATLLEVYASFIEHTVLTSGSLDILLRPWAPVPDRHLSHASVDEDLVTNVPSWICPRARLPYGDSAMRSTARLNARPLVGSANEPLYFMHENSTARITVAKEEDGTPTGVIVVSGRKLVDVIGLSLRMAGGVISGSALEMLGVSEASLQGDADDLEGPLHIAGRILCGNRKEDGKRYRGFRSGNVMKILLEAQCRINQFGLDIDELLQMGSDEFEGADENTRSFLRVVRSTTCNRAIFRGTAPNGNSFVGLCPQTTRVGDIICQIEGCSTPVVLRQYKRKFKIFWRLVGDAYIEGLMEPSEQEDLKQQFGDFDDFTIR